MGLAKAVKLDCDFLLSPHMTLSGAASLMASHHNHSLQVGSGIIKTQFRPNFASISEIPSATAIDFQQRPDLREDYVYRASLR